MLLDQLRPPAALATLCPIFVQSRAHRPSAYAQRPPGPGSRAKTTPVLAWMALDDSA
jgi:hypothetical protein